MVGAGFFLLPDGPRPPRHEAITVVGRWACGRCAWTYTLWQAPGASLTRGSGPVIGAILAHALEHADAPAARRRPEQKA